MPHGDLAAATAVQRRIVRGLVAGGDAVAGYRAERAAVEGRAVTTALFKSARLESTGDQPPHLSAKAGTQVSAGIGYVMATDIGGKVLVPRQAMTTVESVVPVVALSSAPGAERGRGRDALLHRLAANVGADRFVVGRAFGNRVTDPASVPVTAHRDAARLGAGKAAVKAETQAKDLMEAINGILAGGSMIRRGDIIVLPAPFEPIEGTKGNYRFEFGDVEVVQFAID